MRYHFVTLRARHLVAALAMISLVAVLAVRLTAQTAWFPHRASIAAGAWLAPSADWSF